MRFSILNEEHTMSRLYQQLLDTQMQMPVQMKPSDEQLPSFNISTGLQITFEISPRGITTSLIVLCVDDSAYNLITIQEIIGMIEPSCEIDTAANGQLALDQVNQGKHYDLVLLDIHMPVLDGFQVSFHQFITYNRPLKH